MMFNAHYEDIDFTLPRRELGRGWQLMVDTTEPEGVPSDKETEWAAETTLTVPARSTIVLKQTAAPDFGEDDPDRPKKESM